jgi:hypothetical protein
VQGLRAKLRRLHRRMQEGDLNAQAAAA